jgi:Tfp pilus assembly protein PilV
MSFLARGSSHRGTSVLAALVLVAILAVVGYAIESVRTAYIQNTQSLAAAAGEATKSKPAIPDCKSITNSPNTVKVGEDEQQPCTCKDTTKTPPAYKQLKYTVKAQLQSGAPVAQTTREVTGNEVSASAPAKCQVTYCKAWSNSCSATEVPPTLLNSTLGKYTQQSVDQFANDTAGAMLDPKIQLSAKDIGPVSPATSAAIKDAFTSATTPTFVGDQMNPSPYDGNSPAAKSAYDQLGQIAECGSAGQTVCQDSGPGSALAGGDLKDYCKANPSDTASCSGVTLNPDLSQGPCPAGTTGTFPNCAPSVAGGDQTCPLSFIEGGAGCDNAKNPSKYYVAPEEVQAMQENGYTCGAVQDGVATCTRNSQTPPGCPTCNRGPGNTFQQPPVGPGNNGGLGGLNGNGLSSLLQGFARGLQMSGATSPQAPQMACTSDQNTYNQQLQQYQYQMQQYQYQQQMYQQQMYQQQMQQQYNGGGYYGMMPTAPTMPSQPCYNQNASSQCTSQQPTQPSASQCSVGSWQPLYSGSCIVNWQCVPSSGGGGGTGQQPTAQLSCQPPVADVGMPVAVAYMCTNATGSSGNGFSTGNQLSGTTTVTIAKPPQGANTATYGLTCTNGSLSASDQCSIQVSQPSIVLVANPQTVSKGDTTTIGWVTSSMQECIISSPEQSDFTARNQNNQAVNGVASSSPIVVQTHFVLTCQTLGGQTKSATVVVTYPGAPVVNTGATSTIAVSSNVDGATLNHGDSVTITWQSASTSPDTAMSLWLIDEHTGNTAGLIAGGQSATSGTYTWAVPSATSTCPADLPTVCGADLVPGRSYSIEAALYTPANAYLGGLPNPALPVPTYIDYNYTIPFTVGT